MTITLANEFPSLFLFLRDLVEMINGFPVVQSSDLAGGSIIILVTLLLVFLFGVFGAGLFYWRTRSVKTAFTSNRNGVHGFSFSRGSASRPSFDRGWSLAGWRFSGKDAKKKWPNQSFLNIV
ncbi:hypothetical protein L218DRAFT_417714 [Marasmius fiardii PR-910]|nr:hypothetical protein L218DRAFT_417714 [Marasmius fiardii PR-910]